MAMVEVDEQELALLKQAFDLQDTLISKDRKGYEALVKKNISDKIKTHEDEIDPYLSPIKDQVKDLAEWKETISKKAKENAEEEKLRELRKAHGLTDDGVKAVKDIMKERGISDPEAAVALWEKKNPAKSASEEAYSSSPFAVVESEDEFAKQLHKNPDRAARDMAMKTLKEFRTNS